VLINTVNYGANWYWRDEFNWSPIAQSVEPTVTGALVVEEHTRTAGRPVVLTGEWLTRAQVEALETLRDAGGLVTLNWRGVDRSVYWSHNDTPVEAQLLFEKDDPDAAELYAVTLRFFEG
jgi:hypothetical protein